MRARVSLSGAWTPLVTGILALVVILVFILQNLQIVELSFLSFHGRLPLAVALLFAVILGAVIVLAFGGAVSGLTSWPSNHSHDLHRPLDAVGDVWQRFLQPAGTAGAAASLPGLLSACS